jgi:hypothetical protein
LLDLFDPDPGALVVIGDEREEQLLLLRGAISSLVSRSTPRGAQILILSCDPAAWRAWIREQGTERYFLGIEGVEDIDSVSEWILRLGDWTEQRRLGQRSGPPILLVLDTLSFLPRLEYDIRLNFEWMAREGPAAQIWPVAAISTDLAEMLQRRRLLRAFTTNILGFTDRVAFYNQFANMAEEDARIFSRPGQFSVRLGEDWLHFRIPGSP